MSHNGVHRLSLAGLIVTLGIIYGDIGTSPLYVMKAIVGEGELINRAVVLGGVSLVFWTLTIQTTLKYIMLTLRADNNGEGGIFSLYTLVRRREKWLLYPAILGGAAMLSDGMITPPITVSSAIEGLSIKFPGIPTMAITIIIISALFFFQRFGTAAVGKGFGPVMLIWFTMLAALGIPQIASMPEVLKAISPHYGVQLLLNAPHKALLVLGAVFLCTTGAEALYADLGHCGRENIRISWVYVKLTLVLNYLGQAAWLLHAEGQKMPENPFYGIMPDWFLWPGIIISTLAAIIASQALISGSFTLVSEAIRLGLLPKLTVKFPTNLKGQLYLPAVNTFLWLGCVGVVLLFKHSSDMEAAYGLAIVLAMLCTTVLLANWLIIRRVNEFLVWGFLVFYLSIEGLFLAANSAKFLDGGYVTVGMAALLCGMMLLWIKAKRIRQRYSDEVPINDYLDQIIMLSNDEGIPKYATNLVFLSSTKSRKKVEEKILYSILQTQPKRADVYWFVHIETTDEPYTMEYEVNAIAPDDVYKVNFRLGFRVQQRMNVFMNKVVEELVENNELSLYSRYHTVASKYPTGDMRFILILEFLSNENELPWQEQLIMSIYLTVKGWVSSPKNWFGLDSDSVEIEEAPLVLQPVKDVKLRRIHRNRSGEDR
ncbi:MAG TPA: KUP/HAK/KT family potassium transporter [Saprospiraceae bacterium]|nr:KUP/HAK/KT family potassium transporter [Saprospiraceae bacterium]HNM24724.1 KUP/HAK/KT family potassium transporter [Saprospiraceae bacterium]